MSAVILAVLSITVESGALLRWRNDVVCWPTCSVIHCVTALCACNVLKATSTGFPVYIMQILPYYSSTVMFLIIIDSTHIIIYDMFKYTLNISLYYISYQPVLNEHHGYGVRSYNFFLCFYVLKVECYFFVCHWPIF